MGGGDIADGDAVVGQPENSWAGFGRGRFARQHPLGRRGHDVCTYRIESTVARRPLMRRGSTGTPSPAAEAASKGAHLSSNLPTEAMSHMCCPSGGVERIG